MIRLVLFSLLISGCSVSVGIGVHPRNSDEPEFDSPNPIGIVEGAAPMTDRIDGFCMHISSIPKVEDGAGLNMCGLKYKVN